MGDYRPNDVRIGMRCMAPVKKPGASKRELVDVEVTWASKDGYVVEAQTLGGRSPLVATFACSALCRPGTTPPELGVTV